MCNVRVLLLVFSFLVLVIAPTNAYLWPFPSTVKMHINNELVSRDRLVFHCKNKDDDFGIQQLWYDQSFNFKFRSALTKGTLFFCRFSWSNEAQWFNIYDQARDEKFCADSCTWNVFESGPCLHNPGGPVGGGHFDICYPWNKKTPIA